MEEKSDHSIYFQFDDTAITILCIGIWVVLQGGYFRCLCRWCQRWFPCCGRGTAYVDRVDDRYWNTARIGNLRGDCIGAAPWTEKVFLPAALLPLSLIKMISSSAATGLLLDIYKEFGTDSTEGFMASLFMCCSETIFYTISVYFMATGDKDHKPVTGMRWTLAGALLCTVAGMAASIVLTRILL